MAKRKPAAESNRTVGFPQKYNEEPPLTQDLNPDVVTEDSVLPTPRRTTEARGTKKAAKPRKAKK